MPNQQNKDIREAIKNGILAWQRGTGKTIARKFIFHSQFKDAVFEYFHFPKDLQPECKTDTEQWYYHHGITIILVNPLPDQVRLEIKVPKREKEQCYWRSIFSHPKHGS